jgi:hypothetical protein
MEIEIEIREFLKKIEDRDDYILYSIRVNDKYYIGSTLKLSVRIYDHISRCYNEEDLSHNKPLYRYIRENHISFGKANFTVEVLLLNYTREESLWAERKLLEEFKNEGKEMLNHKLQILSEEEKKEVDNKWNKSEKKKEADKKWRKSEKGKVWSNGYRKAWEKANREKKNRKRKEKRANETPEEREERLRKDRERDKKRRLLPQNKS